MGTVTLLILPAVAKTRTPRKGSVPAKWIATTGHIGTPGQTGTADVKPDHRVDDSRDADIVGMPRHEAGAVDPESRRAFCTTCGCTCCETCNCTRASTT